jgi:hypothetical protein
VYVGSHVGVSVGSGVSVYVGSHVGVSVGSGVSVYVGSHVGVSIGCGGLKLREVEPLVLRLPDSVHVWQHRRVTRAVHCDQEPYDVYIGKSSKWANPFTKGTRRELVEQYRAWVVQQPDLMAALPELKGKTLGCWCKPKPCHGDVLAELAERLPG